MMFKKVNAYKAVLVFKNDAYSKVLTNGTFWVSPFEKLYEYDMAKEFNAPCDLNILLKDEKLAAMLEVIEVKNHEIVLQYENGVFKTVLTAGRYAFWKGVLNHVFIKADLSKAEITEEIDKMTLTRMEVMQYIRVFLVESYEKAIMFVEGKFEKKLEPGLYYFWKNPTTISVSKADMRLQQLEVSGQELLTRDKAALRINFYAQYKVADIEKALMENKDYMNQVYVLLQLALREFIGTLTLDELLDKKEAASPYVLSAVKEKAASMGIELSACGIKDVILPGEVKEIMNQVLIAEKKAQANTIMRREETASTRSLLNTAKLMEDNEMLFKLKEMEYVEKIADKINSITVGGGTQVVEQLKQLFVPGK